MSLASSTDYSDAPDVRTSLGSKASSASSAASTDASDAAVSESSEASAALQPHSFVRKRYFTPRYCDVCDGVLLGLAFKCQSCGMRCHLGYGNCRHEDCRAEALWSPCGAHMESAQGSYRFGDVALQKLRDFRSVARMQIVEGAVAEQREFGKMEKVAAQVSELRSQWDRVRINRLLLGSQLGAAALLGVLSYLFVRLSLGYRGPTTCVLAGMQAASNVAAVLLLQGMGAAAMHGAATKIRLNSGILHVYMCDMFKIDLNDLGIDLKDAAESAQRIASSTLSVTVLLLLVTCGAWWQCLQAI